MLGRRLVPILLLLSLGCAREGEEQRARRYAAEQLGVLTAATRVTTRSDLATEKHSFLRVSVLGDPDRELTVVVPHQGGGLFDSSTPGAFDRVARAENTAQRFDQLGADRIAAWFGALGGGVCRDPLLMREHNATASVTPDGGVRLSYRFAVIPREGGAGGVHECILTLAPDGSLRDANVERSAQGSASRPARG